MSNRRHEPSALVRKTKQLFKDMQEMKHASVVVGVTENSASAYNYGDGESKGDTTADIGRRHEYGLGMPRRSFLRVPFWNERKRIQALKKTIVMKILHGNLTVKDGLGLWGVDLVNISKESFDNNNWQALAPKTIAAKKRKHGTSYDPKILVDTGALRASIVAEVRDVT